MAPFPYLLIVTNFYVLSVGLEAIVGPDHAQWQTHAIGLL